MSDPYWCDIRFRMWLRQVEWETKIAAAEKEKKEEQNKITK
jgi:hypothetical protein